jgi:lactoylglutathione lyase
MRGWGRWYAAQRVRIELAHGPGSSSRRKSKTGEVLFLLLCYTGACRAQTRFDDTETKKEEVETMFHSVMAIELFVRDLATCTAFYRDTLGLEVRESESTPDSVSFQMENVYFFLLEVSGAARMVSSEALELSIEGGPRVLLAAGVEDVDTAYETLKARGVTFLRPPTDQPWGLRTAYFADPEGNLWEINQSMRSKTEG